MGQVFIPVRDIARSARWYAEVLGFEPGTPSHGDTILDIPTDDGPGLALDAHRDIGSVFFVQFEDPDGNALMVCQRALH